MRWPQVLRGTLVVVIVGASATACHRRSLAEPDAQIASIDAEAPQDATLDVAGWNAATDAANNDGPVPDAPGCYPIFHACTSNEQCCAPNRCLNITGAPACQQEGPADAGSNRNEFTSWTPCDSRDACLCDAIRSCAPVVGGRPLPLGSERARVCAIDGDLCEYVVFVETEGGGTARRCRIPIGGESCRAGFGNAASDQCVDLFTCNLLRGDCPPDVTACR